MNNPTFAPATRRGKSSAGWVKKLAAGAVATAVAATGLVVATAPAQAATGGVGWGTFGNTTMKYAGTFQENGVMIICGTPGADYPTGALASQGLQTSYRGITGDRLAGINRVLTEYSGTSDRNTAAALEYAIARVVDPQGALRNFAGQTMGSYDAVINFDLYGTAGPGNVAAIQQLANQITNEINSTTAGSGVTGSGDLVFTVDGLNNYNGTVQMNGTAGATGTITLTNGIFVSTGTNTLTGAQQGVPYSVTGVAPTEDGADYKISGTGTFTTPGQSGYAANVTVWNPTVAGQQVSLSAGSMAVNQPFNVSGEDPMVRGVQFLPVVGTTATTFIQPGQAFTDTLRFSTTADSAGTNNNWFVSNSGNYAPVTANGTVYGPFAEQPAESDTVPADAPVAGTATVTTSLADGPTVEYTGTSDAVADDAGFYTWVWEIDWNDQNAGTKRVVPGPSVGNEDQEAYYFQDRFGQVVETSISPMDVSATTQVVDAEVPLSGVAADVATVSNNGFWLQAEGENIPLTVRWDAYYDTSAEVAQVPASEIPATATHLGTVTEVIDGPGDVSTPTELEDGGIQAPAAGEGNIVWVFSIDAEAQGEYAGYVKDFTDDYGVPTEVSRISQPEVSTQSQAGAKVGETITDTAIVEGTLPATGAELSFEAYKIPLVQDESGKWVVDAPEADADGNPIAEGDLSWVCQNEANRVFTNVGDGQIITENGSYDSPTVPADEHGKYLWVESLWSVPGEGGEAQLIREGECGILNETSFVVDVTTQAHTSDGTGTAGFGENLWDTAELVGYVPEGGTVEFELYQSKKGGEALCTADTLITTLASKTGALEGGLYTKDAPLTVDSVEWKNAVDYDSTVYFVEVTKDSSGREVSRGECGDKSETVDANAAAVASIFRTDGSIVPFIYGGAAVVALLGLGALLIIRRRNRAEVAE